MILSSTYVFYGDVYFLSNFLIKVTTLFLIAISFGKRIEVSVRKTVFLAGVMTGIEIIGLCISINYLLFVLMVQVFEIPLMVWLLLGREKRLVGNAILKGYIFSIIINGVLEILWNYYGEHSSYLLLLMVACGVVVVGGTVFLYADRIQKGIYSVVLKHAGQTVELAGFYDSGNCLKDPYTGRGVHIVAREVLEPLLPQDFSKVLVPYHTLSAEADFLEVVYIDEMQVQDRKKIIKQHKIPVGIAKEEVFSGKTYKMILNEEVF